ncbi:MAG: DnaA regulatory inactivator Hda [Gammaproteobacteria bacterium]|nr:DnaA regulatory inactivator Hda [Gammaproteobacteria bacterium]
MQQIPLQLQAKESCTFKSFFPGSNQLVVEMLQNIFNRDGEQQIFLYSSEGLGKSHLLQAACQLASAQQLTASYLPLDQMPGVTTDILQGVEQLDLVAIDGLDTVIGIHEWEEALFSLINLARTSSVRLLFAADKNPAELNLNLADLKSRLTWGPVFQLKSLTDNEKRSALQSRATARGLELPDNVANYLLENYPRDLFVLYENMDKLDLASLVQQRRLTIPFVKEVLNVDV